jgi:G protein-coupled receptor 139
VVVNSSHVIILVWVVALIVCLLMIPNYLVWSVVEVSAHQLLPKLYSSNCSERVYWVNSATGGRLEKISFGILAICLKIFPVIILIIFSVLLILNIRYARKLRERLRHRCSSMSSSTNFKRELRTTTMLVLITLCTVCVELPQGLLLIAIGIDKHFFVLYSQLGDFWDITSISSSFITFVMYCSMSQQFRMEMVSLFLPSFFIKKWNLKTNNNNNTNPLTPQMSLKQKRTQNSSFIPQPKSANV